MKRLLYMMHIPWSWIRQRPHFIAEGLANVFEVTVICEKEKTSTKSSNPKLKFRHYFHPTFKLINGKLSSYLFFYIRKIMLLPLIKKAEIIWCMYPSQVNYLSKSTRKTIIYDCMDNMPEFYKDAATQQNLILAEKRMCEIADFIFTSSDYLKETLIRRHQLEKPIYVVNNAIKQPSKRIEPLPTNLYAHFDDNQLKIVYLGTISSWFDFELLLQVLDVVQNAKLILVGPSDVKIPSHPRIISTGAVDHQYIFELMKYADVLVMPFLLNELILGVNPVKLYEYIFMDKPVIATRYGETEKFEDYIYLYSSPREFINFILQAQNKQLYPKKASEQNVDFALKNTWESRINAIIKKIDE